MPVEDATATAQNPQSDIQYQGDKTSALEPTFKPIASLASGSKVAYIDLYHCHSVDIAIVDRTDKHEQEEVFTSWRGGGQGRYSVDELIPRTDIAGNLTQLLTNALNLTRQGIKTALNRFIHL
jgi:hypothetical protein